MLASKYLIPVLFLILMASLLRPWRNSVSQDDSAYTYSAIAWSAGSSEVHAGNVAMVWPQLALGALAIHLSPLDKLSTLNFLTWLAFSALVLICVQLFGWPPLTLLTFFAFPIWIQYASSYLTEMYTCLMVLLLFLALEKSKGIFQLIFVFLLSASLGAQVQNMAAIPFFWGIFYFLGQKKRRLGAALIMGAVVPVIIFAVMKKTPYQQGYAYWMYRFWAEKGAKAPLDFILHMLELTLSLGLYFIPALDIVSLRRRQILAIALFQLIFVSCYWLLGYPGFSSGVFYLSQFSNLLSLIFISFGSWGLLGLYQIFVKKDLNANQGVPFLGTAASILVMLVFSTFRVCTDIRYLLPFVILIFIHIYPSIRSSAPRLLASRLWVFLPFAFASLILNLYSLDTTEMRWSLASELLDTGVPIRNISAGLGFDSFHSETDCIHRILAQLVKTEPEPIFTSPEFARRIVNMFNRSHTDEWVPEYIIKPTVIFGHAIHANQNWLPGQDGVPERILSYSVMGTPNALAVYHNKKPEPAWCFRL